MSNEATILKNFPLISLLRQNTRIGFYAKRHQTDWYLVAADEEVLYLKIRLPRWFTNTR